MLFVFPPLCVFLSEIITESYERKDVEAEPARSWLEDAGAVTHVCFFSFFFLLCRQILMQPVRQLTV